MDGRRRRWSGLTVIELLVVLATLGILAGGATLLVPRLDGTMRLETASHLLAADLREARTRAIASAAPAHLALREGGTSYLQRSANGEHTRYLPTGITVASVGSGGTLTFSPFGHAENATIVLENRAGTRRTLVLNQRGRIRMHRP